MARPLPETAPPEATPGAEREELRRGGQEELAELLRPAWADVDLDALAANYRALTRRLGATGVVAVVKADGYGHGAARVTRRLEELGAEMAAVALLEEGAALRRAGVALPLLALGPASPVQMPLYRRYRIQPTVSGLDQLAHWRRWSRGLPRGERQPLHLKVDTGMSRLGLALDEVADALATIRAEPALELVGVLSHFAEAEDLETRHNREQEERFAEVLARLSADERRRVRVHLANSAAALHRPGSRFDLVRLGLSLFGLDPAATGLGEELAPVLSVRARIVSLRTVPAGARVSYGGRWTAPRPSRIAVVPLGYADGYPWSLTGRAEALVAGERVPVVGAVTMDMTLLDVTDIPGAAVGDEVVLLGRQEGAGGRGEITARELAERAGTIPYELLCRLGQRLPRRYFQDGRLEDVVSGLVREGGPP